MLSSPLSVVPTTDRLYRRLAGVFFLLVTAVFYWPSLSWLPRGIHEWAQADRLALALSFYDHGLNFFRPQTLSLSSVDGVVGVEFPLVPYLAALVAKVVGRAALVPIYRLLTIATAWLAYYYLFRLVFDRTRQFAAALVPGIFLAVSPVFAYYAGNFLPDPASASLVLVATYYLLRFRPGQHFWGLVGTIALFTLAALIKVSSAIYLLAALSTFLLWGYLQPAVFTLRQRWLLLLLVVASLGAIIGYTLYNHHLNDTYQSDLFLAQARPFESAEQYEMVMARIRESWSREYFVPFQYQLLLASALVCLLSLGRLVRTEWVWVAQLGLAAAGSLLFFGLMGGQFYHHDYYVLAPFWPWLVLLVALGTTQLALRLAHTPRLLRHVLFGANAACYWPKAVPHPHG
jgi:4-amino-4-deoxy-L-arabinose transferase-like glycosyltransferase